MRKAIARIVFAVLLVWSANAHAIDWKAWVPGLTTATTPGATDYYALVQGGATKKVLGTSLLYAANNLSDLGNVATARTNLGVPLGTSGAVLCLLNSNCTFSGSNAYGTPASITLTNGTGLPATTGLTGTTLNSSIVTSSLTTVGTLSSLTMGGNIALGTNSLTGNFTISGVPTFSGLTAGAQVVCLGLNSLNQLTPNSLPCGSGGSGTPVLFVGSFAGSANTYTMASPTPSGFTLTDQFQVCGKVNVTNTGTTTWNINSTGATAVKVQNSSGLQALAGGELIAGTQMCAQYQSSASAFVLQTQVSGHLTVGATSQTISALQWSTGEGFVPAASQTFTLPDSSVTLLSGNGSVGFFAVATTIQASGSDTITSNGATTAGGGSITVPTGSMAIVTGTGISPTNFTVAILYPPVATASVQGLTKLFNVPLSAGWLSGANPDQGIIVSKTQQAMTITAIEGNATALAGGTATIDIYDIASGTASCQGGTKVTTSSFNANTAAGTPQDLLSSPYSLSVGHSLCIRAATWPGSPTSIGTISVYGAPS